MKQLEVPEEYNDDLAKNRGNLRITETIKLGDSRDPKESIASISFSFKPPVKDNPAVIENLVDNV